MTDELKLVFKELVYHIDDIGSQTEWLTKTLYKVDKRGKRTKLLLFSAIASGVGYILKNEKDKQKLLERLKSKNATEEDSIF